MRISANFDGGNIEVINQDNINDVQLAILPDVGGEFYQWFNFRLVSLWLIVVLFCFPSFARI